MGGSLRRPRLAWPFTIIPRNDAVWLIAGEDVRYTLRGDPDATWMPALLERCDGSRGIDELVADVPEPARELAHQLIDQLYGERVLIDGSAADAHRPAGSGVEVIGRSDLAELTRGALAADSAPSSDPGRGRPGVQILVQDTLDYAAALAHNRACLERGQAWIWLTSGPLARGYASPLLVPDAGPCLACLLYGFERLSPVPEAYRVLAAHARDGGAIAPSPFPEPGQIILAQVARWKAGLAGDSLPPASLYELHVLDAATMELSQHLVFAEPECPVCAPYR